MTDGPKEIQSPPVPSPDKEDMVKTDLEKGKEILRYIATTNETELVDKTDLSRIGQYNYTEVREALGVVGLDLISNSGERNAVGAGTASKTVPGGTLKLFMSINLEPDDIPKTPRSIELSMNPEGKDMQLMSCAVPLTDKEASSIMDFLHGFSDRRGQEKLPRVEIKSMKGAFFSKSPAHLEGYQAHIRGLRWLAANVLHWNEDFILPEDLDKKL